MEEIKKDKLTYVDDNGKVVELTIYLTYHSDKFNKDYVVFYEDENNDLLVAGVIDEEGNVHDVETDEEYEELDSVIEEFQSSQSN